MVKIVDHKVEGEILTMERLLDAPKEIVFGAFTDADQIAQWWGPTPEWTVPVSKMDLKVGGTWHYMMKGPDDGSEYANMEAWGLATYKEIDPPNKLVLEDSFSDAQGNKLNDFPISTAIFEFIDQDGKTLVKSTSVYASSEDLQKVVQMGMIEGFSGSYENLDVLLEKLQQKKKKKNVRRFISRENF